MLGVQSCGTITHPAWALPRGRGLATRSPGFRQGLRFQPVLLALEYLALLPGQPASLDLT